MLKRTLLLFFTGFLFCCGAFADIDKKALDERIVQITAQQYFLKARELIAQAEDSISFCMFLVLPPSEQINTLLDDLYNAVRRGVKVDFYVNARYSADGWVYLNQRFYGLNREKFMIYPVAENAYLFHKMVVVDGRHVLEGSMNWAQNALVESLDLALYVDSSDVAAARLATLAQMPHANNRQETGDLFWRSVLRGVPNPVREIRLPVLLLTDSLYFNRMLDEDPDCLSAYLLLSGAGAQNGRNKFSVDMVLLSEGLNLPADMQFKKKMKYVSRILDLLDKKYGLIKAVAGPAEVMDIVMSDIKGDTFAVPVDLGCPEFTGGAPVEFEAAYLVYAFLDKIYVDSGKPAAITEYVNCLSGLFKKYALCAVPPLIKEE